MSAESTCQTCGALAEAAGSSTPYDQHLTDYSDPHRTLDLVPHKHFGIGTPVVDAQTYRTGDWYFDTQTQNGYVFWPKNPSGYEWKLVFSPTNVTVDLTPYLQKTEAASTYVTSAYATANFLTQSSLSNYVTSSALTAALASYATQQYVSTAISSSGHMTQAEADLRYMRLASHGDQYVTQTALNTALASYTTTANLATAIGLSAYLTVADADSNSGFVRKSYISQLNFVSPEQLTSALEPYATKTYVSSLGYLTQAVADQRYLQIPATPYATQAYVTGLLASYTPTSGLAAAIGLSSYLTISAADATDGFLRKSAAASLPFASQSWVTSQLASYVSTSSLPSVKSQIEASVNAGISSTYATKAELQQAIVSQGSNIIYTPSVEGGKYVLRDRANNCIVVTGSTSSVQIQLPPKVVGAARDFLVILSFATSGADAWSVTSLDVSVSQQTSEIPARKIYAAESNILHLDMSSYIVGNARAIFGFSEIGQCEFMVTKKVLSDLEPPVVIDDDAEEEEPQTDDSPDTEGD